MFFEVDIFALVKTIIPQAFAPRAELAVGDCVTFLVMAGFKNQTCRPDKELSDDRPLGYLAPVDSICQIIISYFFDMCISRNQKSDFLSSEG